MPGVEARQRLQARIGNADHFEHFTHPGSAHIGEARNRGIDRHRLILCRIGLERARARLDAEPVQEFTLRERTMRAGAHALGRVRQRLKVDMRGEIDHARRFS